MIRKTKTLITNILFCAVLSWTSAAFSIADDGIRASFNPNSSPDTCADLITECFALSDEEKDICFKESAENLFCKKTPLAKLSEKRANFLTVNKGCLENFDNLYSAKLLQGKVFEQDVVKLTSALESCRTESPIELNRQ